MVKLLITAIINLLINSSINAQDTSTNFGTKPRTKWQFKSNKPFFASPIINSNSIYIGGLDSTLYAISLINGEVKWSFKTKGEIRSNICIAGEKLILNGGDGIIYALNFEGKTIWRFKTDGEKKYDFADYFQSSPVINNGVIYVGSGDGSLYALDSNTGKKIWSYKTDGVIHTTPAISNGKIFVGSFDGYVYALNIEDGSLIWKFKTVGHRYFPKGEVQGSPSVFKNLVIIGARDYNIYAIDQNKGYCHWNKAFTDGWGLSNNIQDSILYIGSADERVLISAIPETGKENWRKKMELLIFGGNAYTKNLLYVGTTIGKIHAIDRRTGGKVWSFGTESYIQNSGKYFKKDDSYRDDIYTTIKSNEQFLDMQCELGGIFSTPCINENNIVFSSTNGTVYCLSR